MKKKKITKEHSGEFLYDLSIVNKKTLVLQLAVFVYDTSPQEFVTIKRYLYTLYRVIARDWTVGPRRRRPPSECSGCKQDLIPHLVQNIPVFDGPVRPHNPELLVNVDVKSRERLISTGQH